jgi:N-acetyl-anhydromuramyl-L-alanine amidase AmpD
MSQELGARVGELAERVERLEVQVARLLASQPVWVTRPPIETVVEELPRHATDRYQTRGLAQITHLVVHHSATRDTVTAEQMARYHVHTLDWPGIGYHFVIAADGTVQQTNELTSISYHARQANRTSVGICFTGNFKETIPHEAQLASGGHLIAWLLQQLGLPIEHVGGHRSHVPGTSCPGDQWDAGQMWCDLLRARIKGHGR